MKLFDFKIGQFIPLSSYIRQSLMASLFLIIFLLIWNHFIPISNQVIFSAIASSTFLTFVSISIYESLSRKIIGGQIIGVIIGVCLWFALQKVSLIFPKYQNEVFILFLSGSTGLSLLLMSILDFEHPPAAGTAMAFVFHPQHPVIADALFIIICAVLLGLTHYFLKKRHLLKDLD